jgi:hypothetical protein
MRMDAISPEWRFADGKSDKLAQASELALLELFARQPLGFRQRQLILVGLRRDWAGKQGTTQVLQRSGNLIHDDTRHNRATVTRSRPLWRANLTLHLSLSRRGRKGR